MNYLAHIYLSGDDDEHKIGNFIADSVKGKKFVHFPRKVQEGIILHRAIDSFTDQHPVFRKSAHRLFPQFRHYSTVLVDVFYDHFLAAKWHEFSTTSLDRYVADFYNILEEHFELLPRRVQGFYSFMVHDNWLMSYASTPGIEKILFQMSHRTKYDVRLDLAVGELQDSYADFEKEFYKFFPEVVRFCEKERNNLFLK